MFCCIDCDCVFYCIPLGVEGLVSDIRGCDFRDRGSCAVVVRVPAFEIESLHRDVCGQRCADSICVACHVAGIDVSAISIECDIIDACLEDRCDCDVAEHSCGDCEGVVVCLDSCRSFDLPVIELVTLFRLCLEVHALDCVADDIVVDIGACACCNLDVVCVDAPLCIQHDREVAVSVDLVADLVLRAIAV